MNVAVVGGGISGLAVAYALRKTGAQVHVLETAGQLGGTIHSERADRFLLESGPNALIDREPELRNLIDDLRLRDKVRPAESSAARRYVYTRHRLREVPLSPPKFLTSNVLSIGGRLRVLGDLLVSRSSQPDESLASFGARRFGKQATRVLLDAVQTGVFAGDIDQLSVSAAFPRLSQLEREHRSLILGLIRSQRAQSRSHGVDRLTGGMISFEGGLGTLVEALAAAMKGDVHTQTAVRRISRQGERWRLAIERDGRLESLDATRLVLAVPAPIAAELCAPLSPQLGEELKAISYCSVAVVHLGFSSRPPQWIEGFGALVPRAEQQRLLGVLFVSSFFPWRAEENSALVTCLLGGASRPDILKMSDQQLIDESRRGLAEIVGIRAEPSFARVVRWPRAIPQYNLGHQARLDRIDSLSKRLPGFCLTGNAYRGVGLNDCIRNGRLVADQVSSHA